MKLELRKNLFSVLAFVGFIWLIFLINLPLFLIRRNLIDYGLQPRDVSGLAGIMTLPFLHDGVDHILGNTIPLTVLLLMLAMTRTNARRVLISLIVLSGAAIWLLGLSEHIVGASALIYALTAYLIAAGLHEKKVGSIVAAVLVGVLYGGTLFWKLLPTAGKHVAWDAHLLGALVGAGFAYVTLSRRKPKP